MEQLAGRVAVVTGAGSGIGRALARRFAAEGMHLVLADVEKSALDAVAEELTAGGSEVLAVPTDVSDGDAVDALAAQTLDRFGAAHVLCNNAGVGGGGLIAELATVDWQWVLGVNLWGVIHGLRAFLPVLLAQDEGHVVNTASMAGHVAAPGMGPYSASKYAVVAMSETLRAELPMQNPRVGVSVLCPGWVNTAIAHSARNRPAALARAEAAEAETPHQQQMREMVAELLRTGLPPERVAERVLDAVRENRFWVFTHPDMKAPVETRTTELLAAFPDTL